MDTDLAKVATRAIFEAGLKTNRKGSEGEEREVETTLSEFTALTARKSPTHTPPTHRN